MLKYCEICCVSYRIYIKEKKKVQTEDQKKTVTTVATVPHGTVANIRNLKKKNKKKKKKRKAKCLTKFPP